MIPNSAFSTELSAVGARFGPLGMDMTPYEREL